jgi:hypothetical protein
MIGMTQKGIAETELAGCVVHGGTEAEVLARFFEVHGHAVAGFVRYSEIKLSRLTTHFRCALHQLQALCGIFL